MNGRNEQDRSDEQMLPADLKGPEPGPNQHSQLSQQADDGQGPGLLENIKDLAQLRFSLPSGGHLRAFSFGLFAHRIELYLRLQHIARAFRSLFCPKACRKSMYL